MIDLQDLINYCSSKENAVINFPFGDSPVCFKYNGHIFAEIYPKEDQFKITLRCDPRVGEYYRNQYPEIVLPGYHVPLRQRKYKNTILLQSEIGFSEIKKMIDHSYETLCKKKKNS